LISTRIWKVWEARAHALAWAASACVLVGCTDMESGAGIGVANGNGISNGGSALDSGAATSRAVGQTDANAADGGSTNGGIVADSGAYADSGLHVDGATAPRYAVSVSVIGLEGRGLVLQNNLGDDLVVAPRVPLGTVTAAFAQKLASGSGFAVSIKAQPTGPSQSCAVTIGTERGSVATSDVRGIEVVCVTDQHFVSGQIAGLRGSGLVLQNNGTDELPVSVGQGRFQFAIPVASGAAYNIQVKENPSGPSQTCTLARGAGIIAAVDVTNAKLSCTTSQFKVRGEVRGLEGKNLILQNNAGDDVRIDRSGAFEFAQALESSTPYSVTIKSQPVGPEQSCRVASGAGTIGAADARVVIECGFMRNLSGTQTSEMRTPESAYHDTVASDSQTGKVYVFPGYDRQSTVFEYADVAAFSQGQRARRISLEVPYEGTYHAVLGGYGYYAAAGTNVLVRADLRTGALTAKVELSEAGYSNQSHYNWGGYSDINFYVDSGNALYVVYAKANGGQILVSSVNPDSLEVAVPVTLPIAKTETGWGVIVNGIFYFGKSFDQPQFSGAFSVRDGAAVAIPGDFSFTAGAENYITSISWDPVSKRLFECSAGSTRIYDNVN
jgi:hypothetical protein